MDDVVKAPLEGAACRQIRDATSVVVPDGRFDIAKRHHFIVRSGRDIDGREYDDPDVELVGWRQDFLPQILFCSPWFACFIELYVATKVLDLDRSLGKRICSQGRGSCPVHRVERDTWGRNEGPPATESALGRDRDRRRCAGPRRRAAASGWGRRSGRK